MYEVYCTTANLEEKQLIIRAQHKQYRRGETNTRVIVIINSDTITMPGGRGRGRGRGRGKKTHPKSEEDVLGTIPVTTPHQQLTGTIRSVTTPLSTLIRIDATIWVQSRGTVGSMISIDNFYAMAKSHEWLGLNNNKRSNGNGNDQQEVQVQLQLSTEVSELINQLSSDEERLLFDFLAICHVDTKDIGGSNNNLYPLYKLHSSAKGAVVPKIEILQQPKDDKSTSKFPTRSEVLGALYHRTQKISSSGGESVLHHWWAHCKNVAQMIIDHSKTKLTLTAATKRDESKLASNSSFKSFITATNKSTLSAAPQTGGKKMTLEERIRAKSQLNLSNVKAKTKRPSRAGKSTQSENKELLELANALRSYSLRRGIGSSGGDSALDRLKSRGSASSGGGSSTSNIARLSVLDLIKDARLTWNSVVNERIDKHDSSGGNKARGGGSKVVNIDLSRVLFQLRLKMVSKKDLTDKRQMEMKLLELLERLSELVPTWIHLRKTPSLVGTASLQTNAAANSKQKKLNIKQSIIVIRNDAVDYNTDVRAKLGGKVFNSSGDNGTKSGATNNMSKSGTKRSFADVKGKTMYGSALAD